jgi:2-oxoisovalerate dehydrogenase E1 component alpha subunit
MSRASVRWAALAQKAIAAGFIGEQVDGNDVVAIHSAAEEAIDAARDGTLPSMK